MTAPLSFILAYCEAIDFTESETLNGAEFAPETRARIAEDCAAFLASPAWQAFEASDAWYGMDEAQAAHDFWLTRNHHGAGFWDGDWPEPHGAALTATAHSFGECDAYLGDDGLVYLT